MSHKTVTAVLVAFAALSGSAVGAHAADLDYPYAYDPPPRVVERPVIVERPVVVQRPVVVEEAPVIVERPVYPRPYVRVLPPPFAPRPYYVRRFWPRPFHPHFAYGPRPYGWYR